MDDVMLMNYEDLPEEHVKKYSNVKNMNLLHNIPVKIKAKLGSTTLTVEEILRLDVDSIVELDTSVGDHVEVYANEILVAYGEIVVVNEDIGVKLVKLISAAFDEFLV